MVTGIMGIRPIHYLIFGLLVALCAVLFFGKRAAEHRAEVWQNRWAAADSLHRDAEGRYHTAITTVQKWRQLHRVVSDSLSETARELRKIRARELAYVHTIAQLQADTAQATIIGPSLDIPKSDSIITFGYQLRFKGSSVEGRVAYPPPSVTGRITYKPIDIGIVLSRVGESYRADIQAPDYVDIRALEATVVDSDHDTLWDKVRPWLWASAGAGAVGYAQTGRLGYLVPIGLVALSEVIR